VRNPVRKLMGVAVVGVLGALFAMPMLTAGAQEGVAPQPPGDCVILSVTPNPVPAFPADVTVTGTAPDGVVITLYRQTPPVTGALVPIASQTVTGNAFSLTGNLPAASDISLNFTFGNQNAYTAGCATPGGEVVVRVDVAAAEVTKPAPAAAAQALAFTGSNDTPSYVLVGIAALVLGAVLVVAARRRSQLS
jgi:LPXTG-motif cell wall-anchored protein